MKQESKKRTTANISQKALFLAPKQHYLNKSYLRNIYYFLTETFNQRRSRKNKVSPRDIHDFPGHENFCPRQGILRFSTRQISFIKDLTRSKCSAYYGGTGKV